MKELQKKLKTMEELSSEEIEQITTSWEIVKTDEAENGRAFFS